MVVPPKGYLEAAREITRATGTLLVLDEVQTGIGRTGHWFEYQAHQGVEPDVVTLAKGLGGGLPIGATVAFGQAAELLGPASTARRSAATRSPARPDSPCSTPSRPTESSTR